MFTEAETQLLYDEQKKKLGSCGSVCDGSDLAYEGLAHQSTDRTSLSRFQTYVNGLMGIVQGMAKGFTIRGPLPGHSEQIS
jgi:hypothetical protein